MDLEGTHGTPFLEVAIPFLFPTVFYFRIHTNKPILHMFYGTLCLHYLGTLGDQLTVNFHYLFLGAADIMLTFDERDFVILDWMIECMFSFSLHALHE